MKRGTKAYKTRRENLRAGILKCTNEALKDKLSQALLHTVLAGDTFVALSDQIPRLSQYLKDVQIEEGRVAERLSKNVENAEAATNNIPNPDIRHWYTSSNEILRKAVNDVKKCYKGVRLAENLMWLSAYRMVESTLFDKILPPDDSRYAREAVIKLLDFLVGLTGIGPFKDAIEKIRSMGSVRAEGLNVADAYMNQLDEYSSACYRWCIVAQLLIDAIERIDAKSPLSVEDAVRRVEDRREGLSRIENST